MGEEKEKTREVSFELIERTIHRFLEMPFENLAKRNKGEIWKPLHDILNIVLVAFALRKCGYNKVRAAKLLKDDGNRNTVSFYTGKANKRIDEDIERVEKIIQLLRSLFGKLPRKKKSETIYEYLDRITEEIEVLKETFDYLVQVKKGNIHAYILSIAEKSVILLGLKMCKCNREDTSDLLGCSRNTLWDRLKKHPDILL